MTKNIYLAGPFFDEKNEQRNRAQKAFDALSKNPTVGDIYLPMNNQEADAPELSLAWSKEVYQRDINAMENADAIVAIHDFEGHGMDEGTAFEIGWAIDKKYIVLFQENKFPVNVMILQGANYFTDSFEELSTIDFDNEEQKPYSGEII
ncbi:nucleoside deoxyribosyltransferase [Companilactobacillus sp. RD055328]|uniref:nucleoside 2-deoxyribosyltransferase n=1 Tax=Companilactobacillus sp. RD055328 TaxID=2916634 RepID=UPI001FC8A8AE|nr:nucleoside 2-deoxyribosyltransferase [Companilactobacillus sp. RD055328]GKQ43202.1 nucleoside deoxyribosyltransferase [Companilactobacillus sp. RD055328]